MEKSKLIQKYAIEGLRKHVGEKVKIEANRVNRHDLRIIDFEVTITGVLESIEFYHGYLLVKIHGQENHFVVFDLETEGI